MKLYFRILLEALKKRKGRNNFRNEINSSEDEFNFWETRSIVLVKKLATKATTKIMEHCWTNSYIIYELMKKAEDHLLRFIKILVEREFSTIFELPFSIHNRDEIRLNGNKLRVILTGRKKRFRKICSWNKLDASRMHLQSKKKNTENHIFKDV